jgi:transglutaminase-like putative cysteine protease
MTATLDSYDGQNSWSASQPASKSYHAGDQQPSATNVTHTNTYHIRFLVSLAGNRLYAPGDEVAGFSVASRALAGSAGSPTAWFSNETLSAGDDYVAAGYVSSATQDQLRAVPYPADLSGQAAAITYPDGILQEYSSQSNISSEVAAKAHEVTTGATSMYDAALRIEDYLRTFQYSLTNPETPPGQDAVAHFLQVKTGYCTFFASAMALMGRSLGMPTRIVEGFTGGTFDEKAHAFVVKGTASHVWTQIYFGQYGWINFEPTSSFSKFNRALAPGTGGNITPGPGTPNPGNGTRVPTVQGGEKSPDFGSNPTGNGGANLLVTAGLGASLFIALLLLGLALALTWWRLLFRGLPPVAAAFARVARLGAWAGAPPQRSQTPSEYADELGGVLPGQRQSLRRLSDIYTRERWGGGASPDALREMPRLYDRVRVAATRVIVQRLRGAPQALLGAARRERARRRHRLE